MNEAKTFVAYILHERKKGSHSGGYTVIPTLLDRSVRVDSFDPLERIDVEPDSGRANVIAQIRRLWKDIRKTGNADHPEYAKAVQNIGFDVSGLIPNTMDLLRQTSGVENVIFVTNDPEIPWQWARHGSSMLCLDYNFGMKLPSQSEGKMPEAPARVERRERELTPADLERHSMILLADYGGTRSSAPRARKKAPQADLLYGSKQELDHLRQRYEKRFEVVTVEPDPSRTRRASSEFLDKLTDHRDRVKVVHYSGHFEKDGITVASGDPKDRINAERLRRLRYRLANRPIVFLNGCGTAATAPHWKESGDLATKFLGLGAHGCVVSMLPIEDKTAAKFAVDFYERAIDQDCTVGEALRATRARFVKDEEGRACAYFFNLYGDPRVNVLARASPVADLALQLDRYPSDASLNESFRKFFNED